MSFLDFLATGYNRRNLLHKPSGLYQNFSKIIKNIFAADAQIEALLKKHYLMSLRNMPQLALVQIQSSALKKNLNVS
jgi:hypothetical protein